MIRIAAVSEDPEERMQLARAFDRAPSSWTISLHDDVPDDADVLVCGPGRQIAGAIEFDPDVPHQLISDIEQRMGTRSTGRRFFVVGATGGSGATSVALHLAAAGRGCVVEAPGSGIRRRLGLSSARSWSLENEIELSALPIAPGFRVLLAPSSEAEAQLPKIADRAAAAFPTVLLDCPPNMLDGLAARGDICVLVVLPTRPAAERAREILSSHGAPRWAVVTNRVGPGSGLTRRRLEEILDRRISIELPCSAALRDAEDDGALLTSPFSPWLWKVKKLWRALETA